MGTMKQLFCVSVLALVSGLSAPVLGLAAPAQNTKPSQTSKDANKLPTLQLRIAKALEGVFASNGFEVTVSVLDYGVLLIDCTKNQGPHVVCRRLYETYPETRTDADILRAAEIRELVFRYQDGLFTETKQYRKLLGSGTPVKKSTQKK